MSRHVVRSDDTYEVVVGYDPPLETYFGQVTDVQLERKIDEAIEQGNPLDPEPDPVILWVGADGRFWPLTKVEAALAPYCDAFSDELIHRLIEDKNTAPEPSPLQRFMRERMDSEDKMRDSR